MSAYDPKRRRTCGLIPFSDISTRVPLERYVKRRIIGDRSSAIGGNSVLSSLSKRLYATLTFEEAITTILDDVIALLGAEYGNVQLPIGGELVIVAQRGLTEPFLKTFKRVKKEDGCACGQALRSRRTVVISDVTKDPEFAVYLRDAKAAGFRAVQSTPFVTSDGLLLGMVSTHFAHVHEPTPIEITTLQTYSVVAADHAYRLLGNAMIGEKAEKMNDFLYRSILFPASA
jgi:hypothetical protein